MLTPCAGITHLILGVACPLLICINVKQEWMVTKLLKKSKSMRSNNIVAVDCEMVLCEDGTEGLVKVCVVDRDLKVLEFDLIEPSPETRFSGFFICIQQFFTHTQIHIYIIHFFFSSRALCKSCLSGQAQ